MRNENVIEIIKELCVEKKTPMIYEMDKVYTAASHGYYFVRPGVNSDRFFNQVIKAFEKGISKASKKVKKEIHIRTVADSISDMVAKNVLKVIRNAFDEDYFKSQVSNMVNDELCDAESLLYSYLNIYNEEQTLNFLQVIHDCSYYYGLFTSSTEASIPVKLASKCHENDESVPTIETDSISNCYMYIARYPKFMFKYLTQSEIAKAICDNIVTEKTLAANIARLLYYVDDAVLAVRYAIIVSNFINTCDAEPYGDEM